MARMKGNRGPNGERLPGGPFDLPVGGARSGFAPARDHLAVAREQQAASAGRRIRIRLVLGSLAILGIAAIAIAGYLKSRDHEDPIAVPPPEAQASAASAESSSGAGTTSAASPFVAAVVATATATATFPPATSTPSPTIAPSATATVPPATATPSGPSAVRVKYTVVAGDSCDLIRQKFRFPANTFDDFYLAMGRISGRTPSNQCTFSPGDVVCIPAANDLAQLASLVRDIGCLTTGIPSSS